MRHSKLITLSLVFVFTLSVVSTPKVEAQTATSSVEILQLLETIKELQKQITALQEQQATLRNEINQNIQLARQLSLGMSGEDVRTLQEMLATDPDIYPEGLVTGFFGPLTEKAVKKFQEKSGISNVGRVGPQTLSRINQLLTEGAGKSGKIPPGLLKAPGIAKKFPGGLPGTSTTTPSDTVAPVISNSSATSTDTTVSISWNTNEPATGKVWLGTTTPVTTSNSSVKSSASKTTSHSFSFENLATSTLHYYLVSSTDAAGNTSTSTQASISTLE